MADKKKITTAVVAGATALALVLGGTFAWTSISQQARNEAVVDINPGGRLHDDFDGRNLATAGVLANKDVYVENFGDETTGVPIYARIRLDQYMEIGQEAGTKGATDKKADPLVDGTDIDDLTGWTTYIPGEDAVIDENDPFFEYWSWTLGNSEDHKPVYMPTFNKNKDSLKADINGTYEGTVAGDIVHYDDYVVYTDGTTVTADATYDWDDDTDEDYDVTTRDRSTPIDDADVLLEEETHTGAPISSAAEVILMSEYMAKTDDEKAAFVGWIYDVDGWAYWSQAIQPGETTGLLLDGVTMSKVPDDNWYYSINVVGQFATASDWTLLYVSTEEGGGGSMTDDAKALMESITGAPAVEEIILVLDEDSTNDISVSVGDSITVKFTQGENEVDLSSLALEYTGTDEDGNEVAVDLVVDTDYTWAWDETSQKGTLVITNEALTDTTITVADANNMVYGSVYVESEEGVLEPDADYVSIGYAADANFKGYLAPGGTLQLAPSAFIDGQPQNPADISSSELTWTIEDADSATTTVDENNLLTIGSDETENKVISATVTYKDMTDTFRVYVSSSDITTTISSSATEYVVGNTYQLTATVKRGEEDVTSDTTIGPVRWGVYNDEYLMTDGAEIDENGNLNVSVAGTYVVIAMPNYGDGAELQITVTEAETPAE